MQKEKTVHRYSPLIRIFEKCNITGELLEVNEGLLVPLKGLYLCNHALLDGQPIQCRHYEEIDNLLAVICKELI